MTFTSLPSALWLWKPGAMPYSPLPPGGGTVEYGERHGGCPSCLNTPLRKAGQDAFSKR
jgi:hypothetical protein